LKRCTWPKGYFSSTLLVYNIYILGNISRKTNTLSGQWRLDNKKRIKEIFICSVAAVIFSLFFLAFKTIFFIIHLGIITFLYVNPFGFTVRRFPFLKIFLLSYVWSAATVWIPVIEAGVEYELAVLNLFIERFLFIFALAIPFDIRDIKPDSNNNLLTIPSYFGIKKSKFLILIIIALFITLSFFHYGNDFIFYFRAISTGLCLIIIVCLDDFVNDFFYMFFIDGIMVVNFLLLSIFKFII
jgi:4-hydroxybenzoate polyprenyltransferase